MNQILLDKFLQDIENTIGSYRFERGKVVDNLRELQERVKRQGYYTSKDYQEWLMLRREGEKSACGWRCGMNKMLIAKELVAAANDLMAAERIVAQWETLPSGWTKGSLKSFWDSLSGSGSVKDKFYRCVDKIKGTDIDNPEAFCGSLFDQFLDPSWRGEGR